MPLKLFNFRLLVTVPTRTDNDVALYNSITNGEDSDGGTRSSWEDDYPDYYEDSDPMGDGDGSRWDSFSDIKEYSDDSKIPVCHTHRSLPLLLVVTVMLKGCSCEQHATGTLSITPSLSILTASISALSLSLPLSIHSWDMERWEGQT